MGHRNFMKSLLDRKCIYFTDYYLQSHEEVANKFIAKYFPIPEPAPVITATLFSNVFIHYSPKKDGVE